MHVILFDLLITGGTIRYKTGDHCLVKEDEVDFSLDEKATFKDQLGLTGSNWHKTEEGGKWTYDA